MDISTKILSDITVYMKYARYIPEKKRRETWKELVERNKKMHIKKYPELKSEIEKSYKFVLDKKETQNDYWDIYPTHIYIPKDYWTVSTSTDDFNKKTKKTKKK